MSRYFTRERPEVTVMEISPAIAMAMLETSSGNRSLRDRYVDILAAAMTRGEWRITSQGIGFDVFGSLRDGHHRLHACIRAGVTIRSVVTFGMRPDAYEVTDTGVTRTYGDRLGEPSRIAEVLRLGCMYALGVSKPTVDQMKPLITTGLLDTARSLIAFCGGTRKYYSSAPIKLAACVTIMDRGNSHFVFTQYRALCSLDFETMSRSAQSLVRQVDNHNVHANETRDALARGLVVFDDTRSNIGKIQIKNSDLNAGVARVRSVLYRLADETDRRQVAKTSLSGGQPRNRSAIVNTEVTP